MTVITGTDARMEIGEQRIPKLPIFSRNDPPNTGDMRVTPSGELRFYVYGSGWVSFKESEEITAFTCLYCGSGWHDNRFHPGTCDNCGAPEDLGKSDGHE